MTRPWEPRALPPRSRRYASTLTPDLQTCLPQREAGQVSFPSPKPKHPPSVSTSSTSHVSAGSDSLNSRYLLATIAVPRAGRGSKSRANHAKNDSTRRIEEAILNAVTANLKNPLLSISLDILFEVRVWPTLSMIVLYRSLVFRHSDYAISRTV